VLRSVDDLSSAKVDLRFVNPQTGPFYVEGAEPGDTLALHLVALEPARDWAASAAIPFFGGMTSTDRVVTLQDPLPDTTWIYELDRDRNTSRSRRGTATTASSCPSSRCSALWAWLRPAARCGLPSYLTASAATWTPRRCAPARPRSSASTSKAPCSRSATGHYRQGEGEACGTAVEGAMTTTLIVELIKGGAPGWPRIETTATG
jgi:hypothetical protein